jgi:hypothetical protein
MSEMPASKSAGMTCVLILCVLLPTAMAKEPKLKTEEVIEKHLASLGTPEARAAIKSRAATGAAQVTFLQGGHGQLPGKGALFSEGQKAVLVMNFSALDYPGDQLAFDGDKVSVGQIRPGQRSDLSNFIYTYDVILRDGLLGGTLSTAWPLLDLTARKARLDYTGLKKIDGKQLHEVRYRAKKGSGDLRISLYFDPESFRHVRTQYRLVIPATMGARPELSAGQRDTIYTLIEKFEDFREVDGLTLPHTYKLDFTIEGERTVLTQWTLDALQIQHNQQLNPKYFSF